MAKQVIGVGTAANDGTGDTVRGAFIKANSNFTELYNADAALGTASALNVPATGDAAAGEVVKGSDTRLTDARTPAAHTHSGVYEPADATILKDADIGVTVEARDATILKSAAIGVSVQGYDASTLKSAAIGVSVQGYDAGTLKSADIGVNVEAYDATIVKDADIGVSVQAYDANTAKLNAVTSNFTGTLKMGGLTVLDTGDIGASVQGYDATTLKSADIGVNVEAYDATIVKDADIGVSVQGYDANTAKLNAATSDFTGVLQKSGSNVVIAPEIATMLVAADIGVTVEAFGAAAKAFPELSDSPANYTGAAGKVVAVNGTADGLEFISAGGGGTFTSQTDTPSAFTGAAGKVVAVNTGETALEFITPAAGGGGALTASSATLTTANLTATVDTLHLLTISGMTASRSFILPDTATLGQRVGVALVTNAPASYELLLKTAAAGSTINGVDCSTTEHTRLLINNEVMVFQCVVAGGAGATVWRRIHDGRIPMRATMTQSTAVTTTTGTVYYQVPVNTSVYDRGGIVDTTEKHMLIRRACQGLINGQVNPNASLTDQRWYQGLIAINNMAANLRSAFISSGKTFKWYFPILTVNGAPLAVGDTVELWMRSEEANAGNDGGELAFTEILI